MYQILKDFAGPGATFAAALTAAIITWRFALGQSQITQQQADTALDQLRYNLFQKRYDIYKDVQGLIRLLVNNSHTQEFRAFDVIPHYVVMDEAILFFPDEICAWLQHLQNDCQEFLMAHASRDENLIEYSDRMRRLVDHLRAMP